MVRATPSTVGGKRIVGGSRKEVKNEIEIG